jgi:hypothetical protein
MLTKNKIILGTSQQMPEIEDSTIHLMVTSPPYPMIKMWDAQFGKLNPKIATLWRELEADGEERTITQIYDAMHESLAKVWRETFRVLIDAQSTASSAFSPTTPESLSTAKMWGSPLCLTYCGKSQQTNRNTREKARS